MHAYNKTCQAHAETLQALQNDTLAALADTNSNQQHNSFLDERAALLTPTPDQPVRLKDDRVQRFSLDKDMINIFLLMGKQTYKQFELISLDPNANKFKINGVDISPVLDGIKKNCKIYDFSKGFAMFITNEDESKRDIKGAGYEKKTISRGHQL